jgi:hypothetical protein
MGFFQFFSWEVRFVPFNTFYISELKRGKKNRVKNGGNHKKPEGKGRKRAGKREL